MKKFLFFSLLQAICLITWAQNVGIGTNTPDASLDVRRGTGVSGTAQFWGTQFISHFNYFTDEHTYLRGGKTGSHVILNDVVGLGFVGVKTAVPYVDLTFNNDLGPKISLYGDFNNHYGMGVSPALLSIYSDAAAADIAFGYRSGGIFTERMRVRGNGNVGIGTNNPVFLLDIAQRIRLRSGGNNSVSAGVWLNNNANGLAAFIGMEDDTHVGFFGNDGAGWKFTMNTQTGALSINGSEGQSGQVLRSNGAGTAAGWSNPLNQLFNNMFEHAQSSNHTVNPFTTTAIPGMSGITLVIPTRSKLIISSSIEVTSNTCFGCGGSQGTLIIAIDPPGGGVIEGGRMITNFDAGESITLSTANKFVTLNPGSYTVNSFLRNGNISGPTLTGMFGRLNLIVVPE